MARKKSANPHEMQTKLSALLASVGVLSAIVLVTGVFWRFDFREFAALYTQSSLRYIGILAATGLGVATGTIGFALAWNAAGEKRNPLSGLAWQMFFVNALVVMVTLCAFVIFWFAKERMD